MIVRVSSSEGYKIMGLRHLIARSVGILLAYTTILWASEEWHLVNPLITPNQLTSVIWTGTQFVAVGNLGTVLASQDGTNWSTYRISDPVGLLDVGPIASSGKQIVAAGNVIGIIWLSEDARQWRKIELGLPVTISKLIWTGQEYCAVGFLAKVQKGGGGSLPSNVFLSSKDGVHWTSKPIEIGGRVQINGIAWTGKRYLITGTRKSGMNNTLDLINFFFYRKVFSTTFETFVANSTDGNSWKTSVLTKSERIERPTVVWSGTRAMVVEARGALYLSDDGVSWNTTQAIKGMSGSDEIYTILRTEKGLLAFGNLETTDLPRRAAVLTSPDGVAWSRHVLAASDPYQLQSAAWNGSQFVAVGSGGLIQSSTDGENWTIHSPIGYTKKLSKIVSNGTLLVAVGDGAVLTSPDGKNWSLSHPPGFKAESVAWSGAMFIAVGGEKIFTSSDAKTWHSQKVEEPGSLTDVISTGNLIVAVGATSKMDRNVSCVLTSTDGVHWNDEKAPQDILRLCGITWTGTQFVAVGDNSGIAISKDGHNWKKVHGQDYLPLLYSVAWSGSRLVAVGVGDYQKPVGYVSTDGESWSGIDVPLHGNMYGVTWCGNQFVAGGEYGIFTSKDGIQWELNSVPAGRSFNGAIKKDNAIFVVGWDGVIVSAETKN